jgi:hypothetical protein
VKTKIGALTMAENQFLVALKLRHRRNVDYILLVTDSASTFKKGL